MIEFAALIFIVITAPIWLPMALAVGALALCIIIPVALIALVVMYPQAQVIAMGAAGLALLGWAINSYESLRRKKV